MRARSRSSTANSVLMTRTASPPRLSRKPRPHQGQHADPEDHSPDRRDDNDLGHTAAPTAGVVQRVDLVQIFLAGCSIQSGSDSHLVAHERHNGSQSCSLGGTTNRWAPPHRDGRSRAKHSCSWALILAATAGYQNAISSSSL